MDVQGMKERLILSHLVLSTKNSNSDKRTRHNPTREQSAEWRRKTEALGNITSHWSTRFNRQQIYATNAHSASGNLEQETGEVLKN